LAVAFYFQCGYALLRSGRTPERIAPVPQTYPAFFVYSTNAYRVLIFAVITAPKKPLVALASLAVGHLVNVNASTVNAARRLAPTLDLKKLYGGQFIGAGERDLADYLGFGKAMLLLSRLSIFVLLRG
jgi:hypothetical protein